MWLNLALTLQNLPKQSLDIKNYFNKIILEQFQGDSERKVNLFKQIISKSTQLYLLQANSRVFTSD